MRAIIHHDGNELGTLAITVTGRVTRYALPFDCWF